MKRSTVASRLGRRPRRTRSSGDTKLLKLFADRLFARAPRDLKRKVPTSERCRQAEEAFEFFSVRSEAIGVRVVGTGEGSMTVETVMPDCPFIVDSLRECYHHFGASVRSLLHPIFMVSRDAGGRLVSLESGRSEERGESFTRTQIEFASGQVEPAPVAAEVRRVLTQVRQATGDFRRMTTRALGICEETAESADLDEIRALLRWLVEGGFVFLGYCRYAPSSSDREPIGPPERSSALGIMNTEGLSASRSRRVLKRLGPSPGGISAQGSPLFVGKSRAESLVHRRQPMDSVTIRRARPGGEVEGFDHFVGLWSSKAYAEEAEHVPVLRRKLSALLKAEGTASGSHDFKEIVTAFNSFPKEELFRASLRELRQQIRLILDLRSRSAVRMSVLVDSLTGHLIVLVIMPRQAFSAAVRLRVQTMLERGLHGKLVYYYLALGEGFTARLHFSFVARPPTVSTIRNLEAAVASIARSWESRVTERLKELFTAREMRAIAPRWAQAFPPEYQAGVDPARAADDVRRVEAMARAGVSFSAEIIDGKADSGAPAEIRMVELGNPIALSDLMPTLQNFGVRVFSEKAYQLKPGGELGARAVFVEALQVDTGEGRPLGGLRGGKLLAAAIEAVHTGRAEDDPLNALVLSAGLPWREVALLRAYVAAAFQMRMAPARPALRRVLLNHPGLARLLLELFTARLDPDSDLSPAKVARIRSACLKSLSEVQSISDDRVGRALLSMVEATVRTNYFCAVPAPQPCITLKFESRRIAGLTGTLPLYEIHVNSPRMEGCHLRAGRIARGGIRYSNRNDDYRTEILDLMKTQNVKNALIVPVGSKGGFVVKRDAGPAEVAEAYQRLIRAMLEVTDNRTGGTVVHPPRVRALDGDDPYLVVAADKGTAAFSDVANQIAREKGFWLDDAFASGGGHGFDHKRMGITARGAWESAKLHLSEIGRDPEHGEPVVMTGIGDMSGDVFGNGLVLSNNVKLIAAFNDRAIFLDPSPDPRASYAERRRLKELERSQWSDYQARLISRGGGVFRRGQKRIQVSPEARAALGCDSRALNSEELIGVILRAPVDLLYNGGIGTFVRSSEETDAEVGDHANDECRQSAGDLRCRIIVEGGNLGLTQKARIEFALNGGRINTDAIDNSAGVDTSDHEVNIKIMLQSAVDRGSLSLKERNRLLASCADDVAAQVLDHNRGQALALSLDQARSRVELSVFRDHLEALEQCGILDRKQEALPTRELLRRRHGRFSGLTRPELAVLMAYTKIDLVQRLEHSSLIDDPYLAERFLKPYFPRSLRVRFASEIEHHRLRRELIATEVVNQLIDQMGSGFVFRLVRDRGVEASEVVRAWTVAADVVDLPKWSERLRRAPDSMNPEGRIQGLLALSRAAERATVWGLGKLNSRMTAGAMVRRLKPAFESLASKFEGLLVAGEHRRFERTYRLLRAEVADGALAHRLARLAFADHLLNVLSITNLTTAAIERAAHAYFLLSVRIDFAMLQDAIESSAGDDRWERQAAQNLGDQLARSRIALSTALLASRRPPEVSIERLRAARAARFTALDRLMGRVGALKRPSLAALVVIVRALSRLTETG